MPTNGCRYTDAIVSRLPTNPRLNKDLDSKQIDVHLARQQQEQLYEVLRECGVQVTELPPEESGSIDHELLADLAVVINGTALICKPPNRSESRLAEIKALLPTVAWEIYEAPETENGAKVQLNASDVLYTGREIFVGVHRSSSKCKKKELMGTNMEGAMQVARAFPDLPTVPIAIDTELPLKHYVCLAANDVLTVGPSKMATHIMQRIEREATYRYWLIHVEDELAANCLNVNDYCIYRSDLPNAQEKFGRLQDKCNVIGIDCSELLKMGGRLSQFSLLMRKIKNAKSLA